MEKKYDVIVIGGGPAGLMAAKTAAEKGLKVALLERRSNPSNTTKPCSEILILNEDIYGEYVIYNVKNHKLLFLKSSFSVNYDGRFKDIGAFSIYSMDCNCIRFLNTVGIKRHVKLPTQMAFEKEVLLKELLREAKKNSVCIFTDTNIISLEKKKASLKVNSSEGKTYEGIFIIAADGVNSRVANCLGFNKTRTFYGTLRGLAWNIKGVKLPTADTHIHIQGGQEVGIEFSINPRAVEDECFISVTNFLSGLNSKVDLRSWTEYIMNKSLFSPWFKDSKILKSFSIVVNIYSPIYEPFKDNVLIVSDAANTLQVNNIGALVCGWKAGNVVSKAFLDNTINREGIQDYLNWWRERYCKCDYTVPYPLRGNLGAILSNQELCYLFSLFKEPLSFSCNPFTMRQIMSKGMEKVMPLINKEKPEIIRKLKRFRTDDLTRLMDASIKRGFPNR